MIRLLIVRHGLTEWNIQNRYQGQSDIPLSQIGMSQAGALAARLKTVAIDQIITSDLVRAHATADYINAGRSIPITVDMLMREMNFGVWEGLTFTQAMAQYPVESKRWIDQDYSSAVAGAETMAQVQSRVQQFLKSIWIPSNNNTTICVVGHAGFFGLMLCEALKIDSTNMWKFKFSGASLSEIHLHTGTTVIGLLNDISHYDPSLTGTV